MEAALAKKYEDILSKDPSSRVFAQLGELYRKMGMLEQAMKTFRDGIKRNPSYTLGYLGLSFCYMDMEQYQLAYATLRPLVESSRDNLRLQKLFAHCCEKLEYQSEALETWKYLLFVNPKNSEAIAKVAALEASFTGPEQEEPTSKSFNVEKIHSSPMDDVDDWIRVDLSLENTEQQEEVSTVAEQELSSQMIEEQQEEAPLMSLTLVDLYVAQGHKEKAREVLEKMQELNPADVRLAQRLASLQEEVEAPQLSEEDAHSKLLKMVEEKQDFISQDRFNLLDTFLSNIKQRAEEKTVRS